MIQVPVDKTFENPDPRCGQIVHLMVDICWSFAHYKKFGDKWLTRRGKRKIEEICKHCHSWYPEEFRHMWE